MGAGKLSYLQVELKSGLIYSVYKSGPSGSETLTYDMAVSYRKIQEIHMRVSIGQNFLNKNMGPQQIKKLKEMVCKMGETCCQLSACQTISVQNIQRTKGLTKKSSNPTRLINERWFSKDEIGMANKHMRSCSMSVAIIEMSNKTMLRFYLDQRRVAGSHEENKNIQF